MVQQFLLGATGTLVSNLVEQEEGYQRDEGVPRSGLGRLGVWFLGFCVHIAVISDRCRAPKLNQSEEQGSNKAVC